MSSTNPFDVRQQAEDWQRCRPEVLSSLFYAYDEGESQTERVVSFKLSIDQLNDLMASVKKDANGMPLAGFRFMVHLGVNSGNQTANIPTEPAFTLYLQAYNKGDDKFDNCFEASWRRNSRFTNNMEAETDSETNAIPAAGAYLFIYHWLEYPELGLATPFTGINPELGKRVKGYIFSETETLSIYQDIISSLGSNEPGLDIHCGVGLAVNEHPFSFRPVIEVMHATSLDEDRKLERNATGLIDGHGSSYYDYAYPNPPGTGNK